MPASSFSSSFPAWPTNGTPCLSSWKPGASPTNIRSAFGLPAPNTTCVRPCERRQLVQPLTWSRKASSSALIAGESTPRAGQSASDAQPQPQEPPQQPPPPPPPKDGRSSAPTDANTENCLRT